MNKDNFKDLWFYIKTRSIAILEEKVTVNAIGILLKTKSGSKYLISKIEDNRSVKNRYELWDSAVMILGTKHTAAIPYSEIAEIYSEELKNNY